MAAFFYTAGISLLRTAYRAAAWVNPKAAAFHEGRRQQAPILRNTFPLPKGIPLVWFHCASLGEFEQGRPVIEALKARRPDARIFLTFFSPSGYEVRKNYEHADYVFYLPWDTEANARWFVENIRPALVVFVKYEFWYHYSRALKQKNIPLISISAIFRPEQIYFRSHGALFRTILHNFTHFFVQNEASAFLLKSMGITAATVAGDTRFDRVNQIVRQAEENVIARSFKGGKRIMVIGSAWPEDMAVLIPFMNAHKDSMKFIVAPHEIDEPFIASIKKAVDGNAIRYTQANDTQAAASDVLIVDRIGLLSSLYRYGEFAFIGGGYKQGLHNILEAACYGIPVFFGNRATYDKYQEAVDLVARGGAFAVRDVGELTTVFHKLTTNPEPYQKAVKVTRDYVHSNLGATTIITDYLTKTLESWKAAY